MLECQKYDSIWKQISEKLQRALDWATGKFAKPWGQNQIHGCIVGCMQHNTNLLNIESLFIGKFLEQDAGWHPTHTHRVRMNWSSWWSTRCLIVHRVQQCSGQEPECRDSACSLETQCKGSPQNPRIWRGKLRSSELLSAGELQRRGFSPPGCTQVACMAG